MKPWIIAIVLVVLLAPVASAQTGPQIRVYFNWSLNRAWMDCPSQPAGTVLDTLYVAAWNFSEWVTAMEFQIQLPAELTWVGEQYDAPLVIGDTQGGVALSWGTVPQWMADPRRVVAMTVLWNCDGCSGGQDKAINVLPNPQSGQLRAIQWPDYNVMTITPQTSWVCPSPVAVESTNWGKIKALYR